MGMYNYKCQCGQKEEIYQEMDDRHEMVCSCGKKMQRVWHIPKMTRVKSNPWNWEPKKMCAADDRWAYFRAKELNDEKIPYPQMEKYNEYKRMNNVER